MKLKLFLFVAIVVLLAAGCYDARQDNNGRIIRVNRLTGDVCVIEGNKIIKLKTEKEMKEEQEAARQLSTPKEWAAVPILNNYANVSLKTKWESGHMYYQLDVNRNLKEIANYGALLTVELYDSESFPVRKIPVYANSMVVAMNPEGKTVDAMQLTEKMPMSEEMYRKIQKWDVIWSGFYR